MVRMSMAIRLISTWVTGRVSRAAKWKIGRCPNINKWLETPTCIPFVMWQLVAKHLKTYSGAPYFEGPLSKTGQTVAKVKIKWGQSVDISALYPHFTLIHTLSSA